MLQCYLSGFLDGYRATQSIQVGKRRWLSHHTFVRGTQTTDRIDA